MTPRKPRLAVVLGDPAGIGPELIGRLLADRGTAARPMAGCQIALKLMGFWPGITVQGGLPLPILTPAHGTAFDIAGQGKANPGATLAAFRLACRMASAHREQQAESVLA